MYVAAVPKSGFTRTRDIESPYVVQWFESADHISKITVDCSEGRVQAEVEEEGRGNEVSAPSADDQSSR